MADYWINWRFGAHHLKIGKWYVTWTLNPYHLHNPPTTWFERY